MCGSRVRPGGRCGARIVPDRSAGGSPELTPRVRRRQSPLVRPGFPAGTASSCHIRRQFQSGPVAGPVTSGGPYPGATLPTSDNCAGRESRPPPHPRTSPRRRRGLVRGCAGPPPGAVTARRAPHRDGTPPADRPSPAGKSPAGHAEGMPGPRVRRLQAGAKAVGAKARCGCGCRGSRAAAATARCLPPRTGPRTLPRGLGQVCPCHGQGRDPFGHALVADEAPAGKSR